MTTIVEFLEARIAEDEATARAVEDVNIGSTIWCAENDGALTAEEAQAQADFVYRNSPSRIIAECVAKRAIIADYYWLELSGVPRSPLRDLAAVYSDHPDYNKDWA